MEQLESVGVAHVAASKPAYEVGARATLSLAAATKLAPPRTNADTAQIWSLSADDALDDELVSG